MPKDRFDDYIRQTVQHDELVRLSQGVQAAVAPFNPGDLWISTETQISTDTYLVHVSCTNWPSMNTVFNVSALDLIKYPEDSYMYVMRLIANHFCNMEYIPPESQFELGEN